MFEKDRLRAIVDAGVALASELSLDAVLQKIVEAAAELTGARYAALGVLHPRLGLLGMRERVALVGGRLDVESSPGTGTTLSVEVPVA